MPRGAVGTPGANQAPRNTDNDIWAADLHLTPNGRFLYASERTTGTVGALRVDGASGKLIYLGSTPTEKQPRGFNIDPTGRFTVVSGEKSDMLAVYSIDAGSGALKAIGRYPTGKGANWVEIVTFNQPMILTPSCPACRMVKPPSSPPPWRRVRILPRHRE
jgi:6-phosphogluconolactonase